VKATLTVLLFAAFSLLIGCSKEKNVEQAPLEPGLAGLGYWTGTYSILGALAPQNGALMVKPGGFLRYYEMMDKSDTTEIPDELKADGNWTMSGATFTLTLVLNGQFITAKLNMNAEGDYMYGPWSVDGNVVGAMNFEK
jgi:hypothetical protein